MELSGNENTGKFFTPAYMFIPFAVCLFFICAGISTQAQTGTAKKPYLHEVYSILYEFSEVGAAVSETAIGLQSAPESECVGEFGFYQELVATLAARLESITPLVKMQAVHIMAVDGLTQYLTGLNLYASSCTEADFEMKGKLVNKATQYIEGSDQTITEVNALLERPELLPANVPVEDKIQTWCAMRWYNDQNMQSHCIKTQTEARNKVNKMLQSYPEGSQGRDVLLECTSLWKDNMGNLNYKMIAFCAKNKIR